jgi:hypothetical protein
MKIIDGMSSFRIWTAEDNPRISVFSDGEQFLATINAGVACESFLSVGYSCPNYADMEVCEFAQARIAQALQATWNEIERKDLDDMMPALLQLCKVANKAYNDALDDYLQHKRQTTMVEVKLSAQECWNIGYALEEFNGHETPEARQESRALVRRLYKMYQEAMDV